MGTRCDFYVSKENEIIWLGSYGWDGYPEGVAKEIDLQNCNTESEFKDKVNKFLSDNNGIFPKDGWPWPWNDSKTTDFHYIFHDSKVFVSNYSSKYIELNKYLDNLKAINEEDDSVDQLYDEVVFNLPNMKDQQKVNFGPSSGIMVLNK